MPFGNMEFQARYVGDCLKCGAEAWECEDWDRLEWEDGDLDCLHTLNPNELIDEDMRYESR